MTAHIASWVAALAKLTTPHDAERAAGAMLAYMPFLAELPDQAFTLASMRHVAMQERRLMIPDLREVLAPLEGHWRDNRPARTALQALVVKESLRTEPTAAAREAVARTVRTYLDQVAPVVTERAPVRAHPAPPTVLAEARARLARGNG